MRFLRIIAPFLFVRNWYTGAWELSTARVSLFLFALFCLGMFIAAIVVLQAPVEYAQDV